MGVDGEYWYGIGPPAANIEERIDIQPVFVRPIVDSVNFHKNTWFFGQGS
jgi:hypothetical protein